MDGTVEEQTLRNDYSHFLRAQLESGYLNMPFLNSPPKSQLVPLTEAVVDN